MVLVEPLPARDVGQGSFGCAGGGEVQRLSFTGNAGEYFGIWIVNILLTIVTLGIYSAWAKVRRNRYFYGNTVLLGRGFEYHARGGQILIGRLMVLAYLVVYNILLNFAPLAGIGLALLFVCLVPWIVARGLRFSARVTSYRNVRFDFVGRAGGAFLAFVVGPFVAAITLGIMAPHASRWVNRYIGSNLRYGQKAFSTDPSVGAIYRSWGIAAAIVVLGLLIVGFTVASAVAAAGSAGSLARGMSLAFSYALMMATLGVAGLVYRAGVRNVAWSATTFDGKHKLSSDLSRMRYTWIAVSNFIVTVATLGLMRPWAAVRMARYVNEHTGVRFDGNVGEIFSAIAQEGSAVGAEFMEMEGFDIGF